MTLHATRRENEHVKRALVITSIALAVALVIFAAGALRPSPSVAPERTGTLAAQASTTLFAPQPSGDLGATISFLQARLEGTGEDARSLALLGLAYLQMGTRNADPTYYDKAESALQRSLALSERPNFEASLGMGVLANARHDFRAALRWGRNAIAANPHNAQARGVVGDALIELGRYAQATRAFQKMINLRPGLSAYARISYARELHGDLDGSLDAMELAFNAAGLPADRAWVAHHLGEIYFNSGRLAPAEREYRGAVQLVPGYSPARAGLAKVAAARGNLSSAINKLEPVARNYPSPEIVILLGDLYNLDGRAAAADRQYELVKAIQRLYRANGVNVDLELALFDSDHGVDPQRALARARAGYARRKNVHVADALGWALYANGRYQEARRHAQEALRLETQNALFHFHAGMIELRLEHKRAARAHLTRAVNINPNFSFWHKERARQSLDLLIEATG